MVRVERGRHEECRREGRGQGWSNWRVMEDLCQWDTPLNVGGEREVPLCEDVGGPPGRAGSWCKGPEAGRVW